VADMVLMHRKESDEGVKRMEGFEPGEALAYFR
jgi:hypothetical protein